MISKTMRELSIGRSTFLRILIGCMIMAFTVVNIHIPSGVTEGGILGLTLFFYKVFDLNPSIISPILDFICFAVGISMFGKNFLKKTIFASLLFALFYKVFLQIGTLIPNLYNYPVLAAILGGIGIGVGCGLVVSEGGAAGGDDALALVLANKLDVNISKAYVATDFVVLALSLVYIPFGRIAFSMLTTVVSSFIIGQFEVDLASSKQGQTI